MPTPITLYVREPGASVRKRGQRLLVEKDSAPLGSARLRDLERVVLFGPVELTAPAREALLDAGVDVVFLSRNGQFSAALVGPESKNLFLRRRQILRGEEATFRLGLCRSIISGKIRNARRVLQHCQWSRPHPELPQVIADLRDCQARLADRETPEALLGAEGDAARRYFAVFGQLFRPEFRFAARSRRPPRDAANALLSFGYTLLEREAAAALSAVGLDPYFGILHELHYGRRSLALDLLEEFRQPLIDRLALRLVNRRVLRPEHFEDRVEGGVYLSDAGRPLFLEYYHTLLDTPLREASGALTPMREILLRQARALRRAIEDDSDQPSYVPFRFP